VEIVVADTGCGIPEENLGKLFTPFFTTKPVGKGSGLFRDIRVEPSARFDRLEEVLVVRRVREPLETPRSVQ
jgi:hypothetical protein